MKRTIAEQTVLFISIVKWFLLASCVGAIVGLAGTLFLTLLGLATNTAAQYPHTFLLLPAALFVSALLTRYLAPDAEGHGTEKVIEAVHRHGSNIPVAVVPVKLAATVITLAIGGSAGKEGPCAQIGAGLAALFANLFRFDENDRKKLVICGISAGFATVFGTPIAGAIFGVEVLFIGGLLYNVLLPSFIAGITAYQVSSFFGIPYIHVPPTTLPPITEALLVKVILAGVVFGIVSLLLTEGMKAGHKLSSGFRVWPPIKAIAGGFLLAVLAIIFGDRYLGLGVQTIVSCLNGESVPGYTPFLKILFTSITLNCGGSGGIVTPIFFVGATTGAALSGVLQMDCATLSAIGFVSLLAGAANTPIAASIMAVEMFGPSVGPYAAVACVVSYLMTGHRSVYPSQVMAATKSASLDVPLGKEVYSVRASFRPRNRTVAGLLVTIWIKARKLWRKKKQ